MGNQKDQSNKPICYINQPGSRGKNDLKQIKSENQRNEAASHLTLDCNNVHTDCSEGGNLNIYFTH